MLPIKFGLIGQVVSEKKTFEYFCNIHVYCPGVGADQPLGSNFFFSELPTFSPFAHFLQDLPFKRHFNNFPHSNAWATYVDLAVK